MPKENKVYELWFSPLKAFKGKGSIGFMHEKLGEIWYNLNLISENNPIINLPILKAELGKSENFDVILENPINTAVDVSHLISNSSNFTISPEILNIPPFSSASATIKY